MDDVRVAVHQMKLRRTRMITLNMEEGPPQSGFRTFEMVKVRDHNLTERNDLGAVHTRHSLKFSQNILSVVRGWSKASFKQL